MRMNVNSKKPTQTRKRVPIASAMAVFRNYLEENDMRLTPQRRVILEQALRYGRHFDADELYDAVRDVNTNVSHATVYRTLCVLRDCGVLRAMAQPGGPTVYEPVVGCEHHDHMLCVNCGKVIEFHSEGIERLQDEVCAAHGFRPLDHRMSIRGLCEKCSENDGKGGQHGD